MGMIMISMFVFSSCEKDDDPVPEPPADKSFETLKTYLIANDMDLPKILDAWITTAENVHTIMTDADTTNDFYIIDIRGAADFTTGHIEKSVHSTLADIVTTAGNSNGMPIIVVCYSGQGAGHGAVALRLSGYPTAKVMKWGMSGWNSANDSWTANVSDFATGNANFIAAPGNTVTASSFPDPTLGATATEGSAILAERVAYMLNKGFQGIASVDVVGTPADYFINNFWTEADVIAHGNISTAYRIKPLGLGDDTYKGYNPTKTCVTYCWTGQTSSMITAYMTVIGYNAKSLKNGANSMIHSDLGGHSWNVSMAKNYPLVQ